MKQFQTTSNLLLRQNKLLRKILSENLDAILISACANRFYLTNWQGDIESGYILVSPKKTFVITDNRYTEEVTKKIKNCELREYSYNDDNFWKNIFSEIKAKRVGYESKDLSVFTLKRFRKLAKKIKWVPTINLVEQLRSQKDDFELNLIKKAINIADKSFEYVLKNIKIGLSEKEIAWKIEQFMRENGSTKNAWDPFIVASGSNSSIVHYAAGERKIKKGDQILIDWGCIYQGYACDISRVIFLGTPTNQQIQTYDLVSTAQQKAIEKIKVGDFTKKVDLAARNFLKEKTKFSFGHSVGHGVGIEIHEIPKINEKTKEKFQEGNIFTLEPGIYQPRWGGVRLEDMFLLAKSGTHILTKAPKKLSQVIISL